MVLLQRPVNSARPSGGKDPEGRGSLIMHNRRECKEDSDCVTTLCHVPSLVPSFCRAQLIPEKSLLGVDVIGDEGLGL